MFIAKLSSFWLFCGTFCSSAIWLRVVSMPCMELFEAQPIDYRYSVFPKGAPVMSIEASGKL